MTAWKKRKQKIVDDYLERAHLSVRNHNQQLMVNCSLKTIQLSKRYFEAPVFQNGMVEVNITFPDQK